MSDLNNMLDKSALRKFLLNRRSNYSSEKKSPNNLHIHIEPLLNLLDKNNVSIFQPYNNEINTDEGSGITVYDGGDVELHNNQISGVADRSGITVQSSKAYIHNNEIRL